MVAHLLPKQRAAGSNPVSRSIYGKSQQACLPALFAWTGAEL